MKKFNKLSVLLASLVLLTTVAACGGGNNGSLWLPSIMRVLHPWY